MSYGDLPEILRQAAEVIAGRGEPGPPLGFEQRRLVTIQKLLAGEKADAGLLNYNLESFHAGVIVGRATATLRDLRGGLNSRLLLVEIDDETAWAWLGGSQEVVRKDLKALGDLKWPEGTAVACGEPAEGIGGWRLTHGQAAAALPIAQHRATIVHYADVALLAAALHDDLLASSLRQTYLAPLEEDRDEGFTAKKTLRAYFRTSGNQISAASALKVDRTTIRNRLIAIESRLGRSPNTVSAELEVALRLDEVINRDKAHQEAATC